MSIETEVIINGVEYPLGSRILYHRTQADFMETQMTVIRLNLERLNLKYWVITQSMKIHSA